MKIFIFSSHPDDDIIGCGGSMAQYVEKGDSVTVVYMTSGGKRGDPLVREQEALNALRALGVQECWFMRLEDGSLKKTPWNVESVKKMLIKGQPEVIYLPHELDGHPDHQATYQIVKSALIQVKKEYRAKEIYCYEVWTPIVKPVIAKPIGKYFSLKLKALREHKTQMKEGNLCDMAEGLAKYRGAQTMKFEPTECFGNIEYKTLC